MLIATDVTNKQFLGNLSRTGISVWTIKLRIYFSQNEMRETRKSPMSIDQIQMNLK